MDQGLAGGEAGQGRCVQVLVCALVVASGEDDPGVQQGAVGGGQAGGQLRGGAQVTEGNAQQCFGFVGAGQQR